MTNIDKKNIYNALVNLLTTNCNTCLDKHQQGAILLCAFKLQLIDYAEKNGQNTDDLYESLARTLSLKLDGTIQTVAKNKCNCKNGVCSIC